VTQAKKASLEHFLSCVEDAPEGTFEEAKQASLLIRACVDDLVHGLRAMGMHAGGGDSIFELEALIYDFAKRSNPSATVFSSAEGFGVAMAGPARERVLAQAQSERDALVALRASKIDSAG
jgi:hypothetical protein